MANVSIPTSANYPTIVLQESRTSFYFVAAAVMVFSYPEIKLISKVLNNSELMSRSATSAGGGTSRRVSGSCWPDPRNTVNVMTAILGNENSITQKFFTFRLEFDQLDPC
jgi:hypothetical protein